MDTINLKTAKLQGYVYDHLEIDEHGAARGPDTRALEEIRYVIQRLLRLLGLLGALIPCLFGLSLSSRPTVTSVSGCVANER